MQAADSFFAVIPEFVIYGASPRALQVYAILRRHADHAQGTTFVGRRTLAKLAKCSENTVDRALSELRDIGAIEFRPRFDEHRQTTNLYFVRSTPPLPIGEEGEGPIRGEDGGPADGDPLNNSQRNESQRYQLAPQGAKELHDELVWALLDACGYAKEDMTEVMWGRTHKAAKLLTEVGATGLEVARRAQVYQVNMPSAALTPTALAANWPAIAEPVIHPDRRDVREAVERQRIRQAMRSVK